MQIEISDEMYALVRSLAERHHRDVSKEIQVLLEKGLSTVDEFDVLEQARIWRQRLTGRQLGDSVQEIREDRDR